MPARRSLQNYRRQLARRLNSLTVATTTTAGNAAGSSLVATALAGGLDQNRYRNGWVFPVEGDQLGRLRRVGESALNTSTGELSVSVAYPAQIPADVEFEVHLVLPPEDHDGWVGFRSCINDALAECWTTARLALVGVENQPSYELDAYADWLEPEAIRELWAEATSADVNRLTHGGTFPYRDAENLNLEVQPHLGAGEAAQVEVFRPLDTWIKVGSTWGNSSVGLVNDSDEALINPEPLVQVALAYAYMALSVGPDAERWERKARDQRLKANLLKLDYLNHKQRRMGGDTGGWRQYGAKDWESF
ncbi:MAG: hypothetical protein GEU71_03670 [Actinobacteria bacterium]|nr:hypothetical protein [Actinomycetota bacterium]